MTCFHVIPRRQTVAQACAVRSDLAALKRCKMGLDPRRLMLHWEPR
jgi:hypothetical protein